MKKVYDWLAANKLSLNVGKTKYMIFHFPQRKVNLNLDVKLNNIPILKTSEFDFLGLRIHETLNWQPHLSKIGIKLSKIIGIFKRLHKHLPTNTLLHMYNSLFLPHIIYSLLFVLHGATHVSVSLSSKNQPSILCAMKDTILTQTHYLNY